ncbi:ATP-binding protein [Dyella tabacisoli]|uniref:ATP-binding protein n=1 Tax=Dyella tabacisoli TaxID=2282381 RepID=A0A369UNR4_9GAMM|nr:ATP-binding protein [Dyella tabacisoli]RDD81358.1 ATP-binding protein [Dyella tabacisoli]
MARAAPAFTDNTAFLGELCRYADLLIERATYQRQTPPAPDAQGPLALRRLASRERHTRDVDAALVMAWQQLESRMHASIAKDCFIPWIHLAQLFQLTALEQQLVLIALLPDLDAEYRAVLTAFSDGEEVAEARLPLSAAVHLLSSEREALQSALLMDSALRRWCVLELDPRCDVLRLSGGLRIDPTLAAYLCGRAAPQLRLNEALPELVSTDSLSELLISTETRQWAERFIARCGAAAPATAAFVLQLQGPDARMLERLCAAIFAPLHMGCVRLDASQLIGRGGAGQAVTLERLRLLCRDALLCNRVLVLTDCQRLSGNAADDESRAQFEGILDTLLESQRYVVALNGPARVLSEHAHHFARHTVTPLLIQVPMPDAQLRRRIWQAGAQRHALTLSDALLDKLVNSYLFTETQIDSVLKEVGSRRLLEAATTHDDSLLLEACRDASVSEQFSVAEEVKTRYRLDDIVLPAATRGWLEEVLKHVQHRHQVIEQWGFDRYNANSRNLCMLFYGPSGTGKTMAASIVANELNLGLYRVDLANVLSKYIGDTEKHLAQLFDQAESMNVVLFFDEAESLFSKRTETHDAHDRYANLQTGYLLQRIETYPGIVILSTNLLTNMDKAFTRRFKFMIEYPFPGVLQRRQLWHKAFPPGAPLADNVDFELLAEKASLSGGNINNIALRAAFYAAAEHQAVGMDHLLRAVEREYDKLGKVFAVGDFAWAEDD